MSPNIYVTGAGPGNGKSLIVLGLMELLTGHVGRVGLFRPVIASAEKPDPSIHLVTARYGLHFAQEQMYGCPEEVALELVAAGQKDELIKRVLEKFKNLEEQCDAVVCAGTDYSTVSAALEFDFNVELAKNLGCLLVPVINGQKRDGSRLAEAARALLESLGERECELLALVVNRVAPGDLQELLSQLAKSFDGAVPAYAFPETPMLAMPSVGEVARALNADWISGQELGYDRQVAHYKVAAMELPNFLDHLEEGSLVVTPGDRSDIVLGSLASDHSSTYPQIAGLLLTGDLQPPPQVQRLVDGLAKAPIPILSVRTDTFATALDVNAVYAALVPENSRKIAAALGVFEAGIDFSELKKRMSATRPPHVTPLMFEYELIRQAKAARKRIVLPEGTDERILKAAEILLLRDVVDITLLGDQQQIEDRIASLGLRLRDAEIIDPLRSERRQAYGESFFELRKHKGISKQMALDTIADVSYFGTMMVHLGDVDGMVSGATHTTQHTIRPGFQIIKTVPGVSIVSSVFFMCLEDRVLVYGDCAVNPTPNAEQLADIAISSAETARQFGVEPRIAMLSYSTGESGKGPDVEKVREATRIARQRRQDLEIEGPIQYDAAVDASVARSKMPESKVAGRATVFIFPDLNTGNNTYKAVQRSAGAVAVGPVLQGLNKPVNDLSRGCTVTDIVNTVAITAIQAQAGAESP